MTTRTRGRAVTALVDGDLLIYQSAAATERPIDWGDGLYTLHSFLPEAVDRFEDALSDIASNVSRHCGGAPVETILALSDRDANYRKNLWPEYKANRANKRPPLCRWALYDYATKKHSVRLFPTLEGDDVMGVLATSHGDNNDCISGQKVIVTLDKDLITVPGWHYNYKDDAYRHITPKEADRYFMLQTLTGDPADGYPGCPGVGPVKAARILGPADETSLPEMWSAVVSQYEKAGCTADYALVMARMARICRREDYDFTKGEVIPWTPPLR